MIPGFPITGKSRPRFFQPLELRGALITFIGALAWLFAVRPREIRPDAWLDAAASIEGLDPFRPLGRPIWTGLVTLCARAGDGVVLGEWEMPPGTPSVRARRRAVAMAVALSTLMISSITPRSRISGTKPAPMP